MGLLDEAIREHLELKRRRGADPDAVEREEREALAPLLPAQELADVGGYDEEPEYEAEGTLHADVPPADGDHRYAPSFADLADAGQQDTAELDMQAAMDEGVGPAGAAPYAAPNGGPYAGQQPQEDSLEWELPGDRDREPLPENIPGQERLTFE